MYWIHFFPYTTHLNSGQNFFISTFSNSSIFLRELSEAWRPSVAASFDFVIFFHIPGSNLFAFEKCISARNNNTCLLLFFRSCQLLIAARAAAGEAGWRDGNCREVNACPRLFGGNSRRPDSPLVLFRSLCALFIISLSRLPVSRSDARKKLFDGIIRQLGSCFV